jgi:hypothetical protein
VFRYGSRQIGPTGISGTAVDHDGASVAGADVWLNPCCAATRDVVAGKRFTTDANGRFSFDTPRGEFVLSVRRYEGRLTRRSARRAMTRDDLPLRRVRRSDDGYLQPEMLTALRVGRDLQLLVRRR